MMPHQLTSLDDAFFFFPISLNNVTVHTNVTKSDAHIFRSTFHVLVLVKLTGKPYIPVG